MSFLILDYHTEKLSSKSFQLRFSAHLKELAKANEYQSIIAKKFSQIFWGKSVSTDCCDPDETLTDTKDTGKYHLFNTSTGVN